MDPRKTRTRSTLAPTAPDELRPLGESAYHGVAGDLVKMIEPRSEADPAALLIQFLVAVGNAVGRGPGFHVEATRHHANLFVGVVGDTATGRKGSSLGQATRLLKRVAPEWASRMKNGASSGEGLIWEVRDPIPARGKEADDPGASDKRLLLVETELASPLDRILMTGNTLSPVLRQAWDGEKLDTLVKHSRATATGAHISVIGHITRQELLRKLTATEQANGFANRFIWMHSERSKLLPRGGDLDLVDWAPILDRVESALENAGSADLELTEDAWLLWEEVYEELSTPPPGLLGAVTARAPVQVRRLALIYAVLDESDSVTHAHLSAGLSVWRYAADSAALIFGSSIGDPTADSVLRRLREKATGLTTTDLHRSFSNHLAGSEIDRALDLLVHQGLVVGTQKKTGGRPSMRWAIAEAARGRTKRTPRKKSRKST